MADNCTIVGEEDAVEASEIDEIRALDELRHEVAELRASRMRLLLAADAERRTIERALHDGLQQQLTGLAATLELAAASIESDTEAATTLIAEMRNEVLQAIEQMRTLAQRIYPPLLDSGGLLAALRSATSSSEAPARIDVALGTACPPEIVSAVYFCFVDVLERAAVGTSVAIAVREEQGATLIFELGTDGDLRSQETSLRDRIEGLGGELTTRSEPGNRITWIGSLPVSI